MSFSKPHILILHSCYTDELSYYDDWLDAFSQSPELSADAFDIRNGASLNAVAGNITNYDLVVLLHSTNADGLKDIIQYTDVLMRRKGKLLVFVGNEFNNPPPLVGMKDRRLLLRKIMPDYIGTQLPQDVGRKYYDDIVGPRIISIPHALNPERFFPVLKQSERKIDIGTRSARYYPFLGDNNRIEIMEFFLKQKFNPPLTIDISFDKASRLSPLGWAEFLNKCKGTISTETGSYYLERDDATAIKIAEYIRSKCGRIQKLSISSTKHKYSSLIPEFIKSWVKLAFKLTSIRKAYFGDIYYSIAFDEIFDIFFKNYSNPFHGKGISSRHFDAIGTKTCQIMFPGRFNDILVADRHYIALKRDFSNIDDVLARFRDQDYRIKMTDAAYEHIMSAHTYRHRINEILSLLNQG
ncbi:MAG: glycosyltransferase [Candidatus Brocadiia bacterium]